MRIRHLAIATTFALLAPAVSTPALAQRAGSTPAPAFQRGGRDFGVQQRDRDRYPDPRERAIYDRYTTGRDARWQFAFRDGYNEGLRDARAHRRYDPTVTSLYRNANHRYNNGWGTRAQFAIGYRNAFREGYERGYYDIANRRSVWSLFFHWGR